MLLTELRKLWQSLFSKSRLPTRRRPILEVLEDRLAPATFTWTGNDVASGNNNWSDKLNWAGNVAPTGQADAGTTSTYDDLVFPAGAKGTSTNNDLVGATFNSISISASGYTLSGNSLTLGNPNDYNGGYITAGASGVITDTISLGIQLGGADGSLQFFTVNSNATLTISGNLVGTTGAQLTKSGTGTLVLSGTNSGFTGPIYINNNGGIVEAESSTALGDASSTSAVVTVGSYSQLQLSSTSGINIGNQLVLNGSGITNDGALLNVAGNNTWSGTVELDSNTYLGSNQGTVTISGQISDTGSGYNLTKVGTGTVALGGDNTYRGVTYVNNGILEAENANALGASDGTAATGTVVNYNSATNVGGTLELNDPTGVGFTIQTEFLDLASSGYSGGGLVNDKGDNIWAGTVELDHSLITNPSIGAESPGTGNALTISGLIEDDSNSYPYDVWKYGDGTVIFTHANTYTDDTIVAQGILEITDSQAMGPTDTAGPTNVFNGATLELAVDGHTDSVTDSTRSIDFTNTLYMVGTGYDDLGALYSHSGVNVITGNLDFSNQYDDIYAPYSGNVAIGVDPDPNASSTNAYFPTYNSSGIPVSGDYSLTITGTINEYTNQTLQKVDAGQLILPGNYNLSGTTDIQAGWITIGNASTLGAVVVENGASLMLKPLNANGSLNPGGSFNLTQTLYLSGTGISDPYSGINEEGALVSLDGNTTVTGAIYLNGIAGIGVQNLDPASFASGSLTLPGEIQDGNTSGGIIKLGTERLTILDNNTFTNNVEVRQGVLLAQDNAALGSSTSVSQVIVDTGSALELGGINTAYDGEQTDSGGDLLGLQVWDKNLVLSGSGDPRLGDYAPLVTLVGDNAWRGNVSLDTNTDIDVPTGTTLSIFGTIDDAANPLVGGSDLTVIGGGELQLYGAGTFRGTTYVGTASVAAGGGNVDSLIPEIQTLTITGTSGTVTLGYGSATTIVPYNVTALNLQNALNALTSLTSIGASVSITQSGSAYSITFLGSLAVSPQTLLTASGSGGATASIAATIPTDFTTNGILTLANSQALGQTVTSEVQTVTASGVAGSFVLSFNGSSIATPLAYNASALAVQQALDALPTIGEVGGSVSVALTTPTLTSLVYTITFAGSLAGFNESQIQAVGSGGTTATAATTVVGGGGVVVDNGATLQLEGNITVAGKPLIVQGSGDGTVPSTVPVQWFNLGSAPIDGGSSTESGNTSGRVTGIAVNPNNSNNIYISTAGGGAWRTEDDGKTWMPFELPSNTTVNGTTDVAVTFSGAIAVNPYNPQIIYLGTGEADNSSDSYYGTGIYQSSDGGVTWSLLTDSSNDNPLYGTAISSIVVDPNGNVYAATSDQATNGTGTNAGVWRFNGTSWYNLTSVVSYNRENTPSYLDPPTDTMLKNSPPEIAGPDDDYRVSFPQTDATWSDLSFVDGVLYASLGTVSGDNSNGVYRCINPATATGTNGAKTAPTWYVGDGNLDSETSAEFPVAMIQTVTISGGTGDFTLTLGGDTTSGRHHLSYNASASDVQTALNDLASVNGVENGKVLVTATYDSYGDGIYTVYFEGKVTGTLSGTGYFGASVSVSVNRYQNQNVKFSAARYQTLVVNSFVVLDYGDNQTDFIEAGDSTSYVQSEVNAISPLTNEGSFIVNGGTYNATAGGYVYTINYQQWALGIPNDITVDPFFSDGVSHIGVSQVVLFAATSYNGGSLYEVRQSTNGGAAWFNYQVINNVTVDVDNITPSNYLGTSGNYSSTIVAEDYTTVYLGGQNTILETTNEGGSWTNITNEGGTPTTDPHAMYLDNSDNLLVGGDFGIWGLYNNKWTDLNGNLSITQFTSVAVSPSDLTTAIGGTNDNGIVSFTGNPAWAYLAGNSGGTVQIDPDNVEDVYVLYDGNLYESTTGVTGTFTKLTISNVSPALTVENFEVDPLNPNHIIVLGSSSGFFSPYTEIDQFVFESNNGGKTWIQQPNLDIDGGPAPATTPLTGLVAQAGEQGTYQSDPDFPDVTAVPSTTYVPGTFYVVGTDGQVYLTKDDGINWVDRTPNLPDGSTIEQMIVDPTNSDTVYLVVNTTTSGAVTSGSVYESTDAGQDWTNITGNGLPSLPFWTIVLDPRTETLYLGTDNGVWQSVAGSGSWTQLGTGISNEQVTDLQLNQSFNTLTAATYGRGVFTYYLPDFQMTPNSGALRSLSGAATWTGSIILAGDTTISAGGAQVLHNGTSTAQLDILGSISDGIPNAQFQLSKTGFGNVILSGADTYTGLTEIQQGILVIRNPQALGLNSLGGVVEAGTALDVESNLDAVPLYLYGDGIEIDGHNTGALENVTNTSDTVSGPIHLMTSSVTIGADSNTTLILSGVVDDDAQGVDGNPNAVGGTTLTKELPGELILTGANTYTGGTNVYQGILNIQNNNALGAGNGATTNVTDGSQLQLQGGITVTDEALTLSGTGIGGTGALENVSGNNTWDGVITMQFTPAFAPASNPGSTIDINVLNATDTLTIGGPSGNATLTEAAPSFNLDKLGLGTLVLQNNDSYTGTTTVSAGILNIQSAQSLGNVSGSLTAGVTVDPGAELDLQTTSSVTFAEEPLTLSGTGTTGIGVLNNISGDNTWGGAITVTGNSTFNVNAGTTTIPSQLNITGAIGESVSRGGAASLTKNGAGLLDLTQPNTYTGASIVNAGTLEVDGSVGDVSLEGGTLAGTGTVGDVTSDPINGGSVFPGNQETGTPGQLTSGAESWNSNTTYEVSLASATSYSSLSSTGNINLGNATLTLLPSFQVPAWTEFTIIQTTGTITGEFSQGDIVYFGNQKFYVSYGTSSVVLINMSKYSTSLTITSSANPAAYGEAITLTVSATVTGYTVSPPSGLNITLPPLPVQVPDGSLVTLTFNGTTVSPSLSLVGDTATYSVPVPLNVGTYPVTAYLDETQDWDQSPTASLTGGQVVQAAATTVSLSSSKNPVDVTDPLTITVTVAAQSPGVGTPTGTVNLIFTPVGGGTPITLAAQPLSPTTGDTTFTITTADDAGFRIVTPGTYVVTSDYVNSDGNFASNTGTMSPNQVVNRYATQATITSSANPSYSNDAVTFTITLANLGSSSPVTGLVTLTVTNANTSPATTYTDPNPTDYKLNANGQVTLTVPGSFFTLPAGVASQNYTVTATYDLDPKFYAPTGSNDPTYTQTVDEIPTQVNISSSSNPDGFTDPISITVNVAALADTQTPTGTVNLIVTPVGSTTPIYTVAAQPLDSTGSYTFQNITTGPGEDIPSKGIYVITSQYVNLDGNFANSSGTLTGNEAVTSYAAQATITASPSSPSYSGDPVTFTVNVSTVGNATLIPTGSVIITVTNANTTPATTYSSSSQQLVSGAASLTVPGSFLTLPAGVASQNYTVTASYDLDPKFTTPTGTYNPTLTQTVEEIPTQVTLTSSADPVIYGSPFNVTVSVAALADTHTPTGSVSLVFTPVSGGTALTLPSQTLSSGSTVFNINTGTVASLVALGNYTVTSVYNDPSGVFATSTGTLSNLPVTGTVGGSLPVIKYSTQASISASANPVYAGDPATFTVNLTNLTNASVVPTGSVTLKAYYSATYSQTVTKPLILGAATFPLTLALPPTLASGKYTLTATYSLGTSFNAPTGTNNPSLSETVLSAASKPVKVVIVSVPKTIIKGTGLPSTKVEVLTPSGAAATTYTGPVTLAINTGPTGATLSGTTTINAVKGIATFTGLSLPTAGTYTLIATTSNLTSAATAAIIVYVPGVATYITATVISLNQGSFGIQVVARDAVGNVATSYTGTATVSLATGPSGGLLVGTLSLSFTKGVAKITGLHVSKTGTYTFDIASGLLTTTLSQYFFLRVL